MTNQQEERITVPKDGKGGFYRKLNLDKNTMKILRKYRQLKSLMDKDEKIDDRETDGRGTESP